MNKTLETLRTEEKGFTLVELAVVMIIIGLLIGGILKGQELIANAQIASTVSALKGIDAATSTFRDSYRGLPGDLANASDRLPNCPAADCDGNGNGVLGSVPGAGGATAGENIGFWIVLNAADLLTGTDGTTTAQWGQGLPSADIGGGVTVGYNAGGGLGQNGAARAGHYLTLQGDPAGIGNTPVMTPSEAARIDRKLDDGAATTGAVFSDAGDCTDGGTNYNEAVPDDTCELYVRIQG